jgi:Flp pilus assembly protein TadB
MVITAGLAASAVLLIAAGLALVVAGLRTTPEVPPVRRTTPPAFVQSFTGARLPPRTRTRHRAVLAVAVAAGLVSWLTTGWLAATLLLPAAAIVLPRLLTPAASGTDLARLAALEQWVRGLSGLLVAGAGIEQAIHASIESAPPAIRDPVRSLSARLRAQVPTERALRAFADDVDDATGDLVASALILGARRREGGLAAVLEDFAASVADEVRMRQAVEADRAKPRNTARWVTAISLSVIAALFVMTDYMDPYREGAGQLVLIGLLSAFVASLAWMRRLSAGTPTPRFLIGEEEA